MKRPLLTLTDVVEVRPSPIHGLGLFAKIPIPAGTLIGSYEGTDADEDGTYVLWLEWDGGSEGRLGENELRYLNHSPRPNAEFDEYDLYARRGIATGREITFHYGPEWL